MTKVGDHWEASYTITVKNTAPSQELVYDLDDAPDFADAVTITDAHGDELRRDGRPRLERHSGATTDSIVEDQALPGGATHTFTVLVKFTVESDAEATPR